MRKFSYFSKTFLISVYNLSDSYNLKGSGVLEAQIYPGLRFLNPSSPKVIQLVFETLKILIFKLVICYKLHNVPAGKSPAICK